MNTVDPAGGPALPAAQDEELAVAAGMPPAPVTWLERDRSRGPEDGMGLCLSGGGTRAMMFHAGALLRLHELGLLAEAKRISGVSGGSIAAGALAVAWPKVIAAPGSAEVFTAEVIDPLRALARRRIDAFAWLRGTITPWSSPVERLADILDEALFGGRTLQDLPADPPRFVFNATNLSTGVLWRFSRPYMADYRLGRLPDPRFRLARAVAASSAFPPFFSPLRPKLDPDAYLADDEGQADAERVAPRELRRFRARPHLADGGVYDNLALETVWKRYRDVLVSDGGGAFADDVRPPTELIVQSIRVMKTIDRQVRALRRNVLIRSYQEKPDGGAGWRRGAYWGIRTRMTDYRVAGRLPCPPEQTLALANQPTRLWRMDEVIQERLINWGHAVADAAVRAYYRRDASPPTGFPYPAAGVGSTPSS